jgi:hypothetical protein
MVGLAVDVSTLRETEQQLKERIAEVNELRRRLELENLYLRESERTRAASRGRIAFSGATTRSSPGASFDSLRSPRPTRG